MAALPQAPPFLWTAIAVNVRLVPTPLPGLLNVSNRGGNRPPYAMIELQQPTAAPQFASSRISGRVSHLQTFKVWSAVLLQAAEHVIGPILEHASARRQVQRAVVGAADVVAVDVGKCHLDPIGAIALGFIGPGGGQTAEAMDCLSAAISHAVATIDHGVLRNGLA